MINEDILLQATHPSGAEWQVRGEALTHTQTQSHFPPSLLLSLSLSDMPTEALNSGLLNENCRIVQHSELKNWVPSVCEF